MSAQNSKQGTNSRSAVAKCSCKKVVKDDDPSGIGCHGCVKWFHGQCVSLSDDEVKWLGSRMNCLWMCDACLESNSPILPEAKSLSLQNDNITTYLKSISGKIDSLREVVSKQNSKNLADSPANKSQLKDVVEKSLEEKLPEVIAKSFKDSINTTVSNNDRPQSNVSSSVQFIITGVPEAIGPLSDLHESDSSHVNSIISFLNEKSEGNIKSIRRLGKRKNETDTNSSTKVWRRPLLVTCENDRGWFMERCFHKSYKLQQFDYPVYLKKFLTSAERSLEKKVLCKRYSMIHEENADKHDFKIKNLVLYYKGKEVKITDK